jgi:hypothetical protein
MGYYYDGPHEEFLKGYRPKPGDLPSAFNGHPAPTGHCLDCGGTGIKAIPFKDLELT